MHGAKHNWETQDRTDLQAILKTDPTSPKREPKQSASVAIGTWRSLLKKPKAPSKPTS